MNKTRKYVLYTIAATLAVFISMVYTSCKKDDNSPANVLDKCIGVECKNGGECFDGTCSCLNGYEGKDCGKRWSARYTGSWQFTETVTATNNPAIKGTTLTDTIIIKEHQNVTKVYFESFFGNNKYADLVVNIKPDSFFIDPYQVLFKENVNLTIISGQGSIDAFGNLIDGIYIRNYYDSSLQKAINDTLRFIGQRIE